MPYLDPQDANNEISTMIEAIKARRGPPPWREPLIATPAFRQLLLYWTPGEQLTPHWHPRASESFLVLEGSGTFKIGDAPPVEVQPGSCLLAQPGVPHEITVSATESLLILATVAPNEPDDTYE